MRLDRLNDMERYVLNNGTATLDELSTEFRVSMNTVRRDVADILKRGNLEKVYGGVSAGTPLVPAVIPMSERAAKNSAAKQIIGRMAASLVHDGMSIFLDSGSTTMRLLPYLSDLNNVTVITHSLTALYEAAKYPSLHVLALGGLYNPSTASFVGGSTLGEIERMTIDMVFLAATGVSLEHGLSNTTYFEVEIKRCVARQNDNIVLMADHTKFGRDALLTYCRFDELSTIVTDAPLPEAYMEVVRQNEILLLTPETEGQGTDTAG